MTADSVAIGASITPCAARPVAWYQRSEEPPLRRAAEQLRFGREAEREVVGEKEAGLLRVMSFNIRGFSRRGDGIHR